MNIYVVVMNVEIVEDGELIFEPVIMDTLGFFTEEPIKTVKRFNRTRTKREKDNFWDKYGVEQFGYISLKEGKDE